MEILVLDCELATIGLVKRAVAFNLARHFFTPAVLELVLPPDCSIPEGGAYLYDAKTDSLLVIESERVTEDGLLHVTARGAECLLERRVIKGGRVYFGTAENAVRRAVSVALEEEREIPRLTVGEEMYGSEEVGVFTAYWDNLSEWVYSVLRPYRASYRVRLDSDTRTMVFGVVKGLDRTPDQSDRYPVVLSDRLGSIVSGEITRSLTDACNTAYVVGEDGTMVTASLDTDGDAYRREMYVSARDIFRSSFDSDGDYEEALRFRGILKLSGQHRVTLEGRSSGIAGGLVCGEDYELGDVCRLCLGDLELDVVVTSVTDTLCGGIRESVPSFEA